MSECPRFIADAALGRLARWLRLLGCDVLHDAGLDDAALLHIARSQERILLTRNHALCRSAGTLGLLIERNSAFRQLDQVIGRFGIDPRPAYTRCWACNFELFEASKESVFGLVPDAVHRDQPRFWRCPGCAKVYWPGSHPSLAGRTLSRRLGRSEGNED